MLTTHSIFERYEEIRKRMPKTSTPKKFQDINSLLDIAEEGYTFVFDAFGVLNVGETLIPGADKRLDQLRSIGCKYGDKEVIEYYSRLVEAVPNSKIILYNFEKLCGYKFSIECIEKLVKKFPKQIVGVKDSSYNLYENLKIKNFSILPGSELKLLKGLELGCVGIITATCNVTGSLSRKVYDEFINKKKQTTNELLCNVRSTFDQFNLVSGLHSFMSDEDEIYKNVLPPVSLLNEEEKRNLIKGLSKLNFKLGSLKAA